MMTAERLNELLAAFTSRRVVVVGDYFLDKYLEFDPALAEVSLETGKVANQVVNVRHSPGAAGTVVSNLTALGAGEVIAVGFTGEDGEGYELRRDLRDLGCNTGHFLCVQGPRTPTYLKPRNIHVSGLDAESERYDMKNREPLPPEVEPKILDTLDELLPRVDAVIAADQVEEEDCGVVTTDVRGALAEMAAECRDVVFWADSRRRIGLFRGVIIKPNEQEAVRAAFPDGDVLVDDGMVLKAGGVLCVRSGKPVFVTRAERGMLVFDKSGWQDIRGVRVDGAIDPTGAGDSATAAAVLTLASGGTFAEAALMANLAASITVQQLGVTGTPAPDELVARLELWRRQAR